MQANSRFVLLLMTFGLAASFVVGLMRSAGEEVREVAFFVLLTIVGFVSVWIVFWTKESTNAFLHPEELRASSATIVAWLVGFFAGGMVIFLMLVALAAGTVIASLF